MALIKCHECSTQVSDHAQTCPKCGAPVIATIKRRQKAARIALIIQLVAVLVFGIVSLIIFHHFMNKVMAPLKAVEQQQPKGAASQPMVVNYQPPPVQPPPEPAWVWQVKLGGISGTPDHRFAIINGKMFETGDVATVKITGKDVTIHCLEIGESSVSISMDGIDGTRELQMTGN